MDVSAWQDHRLRLDGQAFVWVRACYGDAKDIWWDRHSQQVRDAGVILGAYIFGRAQPIDDQLRTFLAVAKGADMWCMDMENDVGHPDITRAGVRAFIRRFQQTGRRIGLYANRSNWADLGQDFTWIAAPGHDPTAMPWLFRQHQSGVPSGDVWHGTVESLREWLHMAKLTRVKDELHRVTIPKGVTVHDLAGNPEHPTPADRDELATLQVRVGDDPTTFWVVPARLDGRDAVGLVRTDKVTDKGRPQLGGASDAELAAARTEGFTDAKDKAIAAVEGI